MWIQEISIPPSQNRFFLRPPPIPSGNSNEASYISFFLSYPYLTNPPENSKPLCGSSMDIFRNCTFRNWENKISRYMKRKIQFSNILHNPKTQPPRISSTKQNQRFCPDDESKRHFIGRPEQGCQNKLATDTFHLLF